MNVGKFRILLVILAGGLSLGLIAGGCSKPEDAAPGGGAAAAKPYPLKTCLVSGEELGSMGDPVVYVHEGQELKFCCKDCVDEFKKDPKKYLAKLTSGVPSSAPAAAPPSVPKGATTTPPTE